MTHFIRIITLLALAVPGATYAATIIAASRSRDDVNTALQSAQAGDTVSIPAGTGGVGNWTSGITWTAPANVTVMGAGTSATGGGDVTVIQDNSASGAPLLQITVSSSGVFRMTGITFQSGTGAIKDNGTITLYGPGNVRIDHCHLVASTNANYKMLLVGVGVFGVLDSSILDWTGTSSLYVYNGRDNGVGGGQGNYEWTQPTAFGSTNYFYLEDNIINGIADFTVYSSRVFDGFTAAKVVVRLNNVSQAVLAETHATGHAGDDRGLRSQEIYYNAVTSSLSVDPNFCAVDMGNGTALVFGNTWPNVYKNIYLLKVTRANNSTYTQNPTPLGWGYAGTNFNGTGSMWDGGTALGTDTAFGYPALDQVGRGSGDLLTGTFPTKLNDATGTTYWPNQSLEPVYIWNNTGGIVPGWGGSEYSNQAGTRITANRDYYPQATGIQTSPTSPFNGTVGTGWGTLANRPTTCTTGVAYFATDQGTWNRSTSNPYGVQLNGSDGVLYKATATDTWTLYYEPLTYPHPLRGGSSNGDATVTGTTTVTSQLTLP